MSLYHLFRGCYVCEKCGVTFEYPSMVMEHIREKHPIEYAVYHKKHPGTGE
jgi:Zinc finger, C2H2 type